MIPIIDGTGLRIAHTFNGLTINNPTDNAVDPKTIYELDQVTPLVTLDSVSDPHQFRDGMESYSVRKVSGLYRVDGTIRAVGIADLFDRMKALAKAFDPAKLAHENPATQGYLPYDFSVPTLDTANYPSGFVASRYYLRPRAVPAPVINGKTGLAAFFSLDLVAADPRRYLQTTSSVTATGVLNNLLADYRSWPIITLNMGGAGSATCSITNTTSLGAQTLTLNLSTTTNGNTVVIDMENQKITYNTTLTPSMYVSGNWWEIEPGNQTISNANFTNVTSWSIVWRRAFCL